MSTRASNIRKYHSPININIGMLVFLCIFGYLVICVVMYFRSDPVVGYEVKKGSLSVNNIYEGIALRNENLVTSTDAGYVNYYAREGERVAVGNLVYSVDETGRLKDYLTEHSSNDNPLSDSDLLEIKSDIVNFIHNFSTERFNHTYDFKYSMQGTVLKLANNALLGNIEALTANNMSGNVNLCYSPNSGIAIYSVDGFEERQPSEIKGSDFDKEHYNKTLLLNNHLVAAGDPVYKLSTSEDWSLVIRTPNHVATELKELEYVKVRFLKNQYESWGKVDLLGICDDDSDSTFVELCFTNSMITFCTDRFLDVELITEEEEGLKIPNSAIVQKEFFLVPEDYLQQGNNSSSFGVIREIYNEDGSKSSEFVETPIYEHMNSEYYLDDSQLRIGDVLLKPNSMEPYTVSKRGGLIGVYNINKGYADFKQIQILYQNEEYSIVKSNTEYGLNAYDYIALDAETVTVNDFIYE